MNSPAVSSEIIRERLGAGGIELGREQIEQLAAYFSLLVKWNRAYNLTGFRQAGDLLDRNLIECLILRKWLRGKRIADLGTGAGLPGIPLAIAEPGREFTLIESRAKRVRFLRHVRGDLMLANVEIAFSRAEDLPTGSAFDTVLARAVAPPMQLLALVRHLTVPGSVVLMLTSEQRSLEYRDLAPDFAIRPIEPSETAGIESAVVRLERIED